MCDNCAKKDEEIAALKESIEGLEITTGTALTNAFKAEARIKEMQEMIAFLIAFVPDLTERNKFYDWLSERREG